MAEAVFHWIAQYGSLGLFSCLVLGILGLPIPDEVLLTYAGFLAFRGRLDLYSAMVAAFGGSMCGISLSYGLGDALGHTRIERWGSRVGITQEKLERVRLWFARRGKWTLTFGYFVPGARHLTALVAGASRLRMRVFMPFAYAGALLWSQTFILLGYSFGTGWKKATEKVHHVTLVVLGIAAMALLVSALVRRFVVRRRGPVRQATAPGPPDRQA